MSYNVGAGANGMAQGVADVSRFLEAGEQVVWQGQPARGAGNPMHIAGLIVLGIGVLVGGVMLLVGFILSNSSGATHNAGLGLLLGGGIVLFVMVLLGVIFLTVGATMMGRNISYTLTARRAIIAAGPTYGGYRTTLIDLDAVGIIKVVEGRNGTGSIIFGRGSSYSSSNGYNSYSYYDRDYSFANIADVMSVYRQVRQAQDGMEKVQGLVLSVEC